MEKETKSFPVQTAVISIGQFILYGFNCKHKLPFAAGTLVVCAIVTVLAGMSCLVVKRSKRKFKKGDTLVVIFYCIVIITPSVSVAVPDASNVVYDYVTPPPVTSIITEYNSAYAIISHQTKTDPSISTDSNVAYANIIPSPTST